ncbi:MAG: amidohydrolase family protein [Oceanibaculum nanhaiense]|uniref:amidohydrolase family protein n=1 Tax=Oceanibaculum nanhaiense TaxID=1909734 RepID=UPI0025A428D7|nr:amidohydrolase family protein [Oceanibaculum nanhaiense]MDM7946992.1 amidohydrolase family protein [Oceanibaculum nanhaiense]
MTETTVIRNADWVVAFDKAKGEHVYLCDADVAFEGNRITHVGKGYEGTADVEIDGRNRVVMPGMINVHSHPTSEPLRKGITDETRSPGFWHSSLYEYLSTFENDPDGYAACMQVALAELLMSGCTTVADLSIAFDGWLDTLADSGIRAVIAPMYRDARWYTTDGHELKYDWNKENGRKGFEKAARLLDLAKQHPSGRLSGMVCPAQIDTCSPELIRDSYDLAVEKNLPFQIHAAQSVTEFLEMQRRHGLTPIQWMDSIGALGEHAIIGHGIFLDHHPWLHWTTRKDLGLLADSGSTVAHCPTVFARRGITLRTFGGYLRAGVNMGIGTDTYPHNFLEEMRCVAMYARVIGESVDDLNTSDVFNAATMGGAKALRQPDIGGIAPGFKADIVLLDARHPAMMPLREPVRSLVYVAGDRAVNDVFVDGNQVVKNGKCLTIDLQAASEALQEAQQRSLKKVSKLDWNGRSADELAPMAYRTVDRLN